MSHTRGSGTSIALRVLLRGGLGLICLAVTLFSVPAKAQVVDFPGPSSEIAGLNPNTAPVRPVTLSLFPFMSMNGAPLSSLPLNHFSINATVEISGPLVGMEISGLASIREGQVKGMQVAGLANVNWSGDVRAMQIAGLFNFTTGSVRGMQVAGLINANWEGPVKGMQVAGWLNVSSGETRGMQVAGMANVSAGSLRGMQIAGLINWANEVRGMQIGLVNVSRGDVKGVQLGLINVAPKSSFSLGIVNVIPGGRNGMGLTVDSAGSQNLEFTNGGTHWHTFFSLGVRESADLSDGDQTLVGLGFGLHFTTTYDTLFRIDAFHRQAYFADSTFMGSTLRLSLDIPLARPLHLTLGAGLTIYVYDGDLDRPGLFYKGWLLRDGENSGGRHEVLLAPQLSAGLSCVF